MRSVPHGEYGTLAAAAPDNKEYASLTPYEALAATPVEAMEYTTIADTRRRDNH